MCTVTLDPAVGQHASRDELLAVALAAKELLEGPCERPAPHTGHVPELVEEVRRWDRLRDALLEARIGWREYS